MWLSPMSRRTWCRRFAKRCKAGNTFLNPSGPHSQAHLFLQMNSSLGFRSRDRYFVQHRHLFDYSRCFCQVLPPRFLGESRPLDSQTTRIGQAPLGSTCPLARQQILRRQRASYFCLTCDGIGGSASVTDNLRRRATSKWAALTTSLWNWERHLSQVTVFLTIELYDDPSNKR